jgi:hypothetical protein
MKRAVETTDIFRGAFFLCNGGMLREARFNGGATKTVTFLIEGEGINELDQDYRSGKALVNPVLLREWLNHLRDILFNKLSEGKTGGRYDRKRDASIHQRRC